MGVYAAMSISGAAVGLILGGILVQLRELAVGAVRQRADRPARRASSRPGCSASPSGAPASSTCPARSPAASGSPPWCTGCPTPRPPPTEVSHWGDTKVLVSLAAAVVLLVSFAFIEVRASTRWSRSGWCGPATVPRSYLISLCIGTAIFGMFFFLTIFVQVVWGLQPGEDRAGLPADGGHDHAGLRRGVAAGARIGARPLMWPARWSPPAGCSGCRA